MADGLKIEVDALKATHLKNLSGDLILVNETVVYIKYAYTRKGTKQYGFRNRKTREFIYVYAAEVHTWNPKMNGYYTMTDKYTEYLIRGCNLYHCREKYLAMENQILKMRERYVDKPSQAENASEDTGTEQLSEK